MPDLPVLAIVTALCSLVVTILWLVIGWRAMRAHETLAANSTAIRDELRKIGPATPPMDRRAL